MLVRLIIHEFYAYLVKPRQVPVPLHKQDYKKYPSQNDKGWRNFLFGNKIIIDWLGSYWGRESSFVLLVLFWCLLATVAYILCTLVCRFGALLILFAFTYSKILIIINNNNNIPENDYLSGLCLPWTHIKVQQELPEIKGRDIQQSIISSRIRNLERSVQIKIGNKDRTWQCLNLYHLILA